MFLCLVGLYTRLTRLIVSNNEVATIQEDASNNEVATIHSDASNNEVATIREDEENGEIEVVFSLSKLDGVSDTSLTVLLHPDWSPLGVQHFLDLVDRQFFDRNRIFRVVPNFIVQFGINPEPEFSREIQFSDHKDSEK